MPISPAAQMGTFLPHNASTAHFDPKLLRIRKVVLGQVRFVRPDPFPNREKFCIKVCSARIMGCFCAHGKSEGCFVIESYQTAKTLHNEYERKRRLLGPCCKTAPEKNDSTVNVAGKSTGIV